MTTTGTFGELLGADHRRTLEFFATGLLDVSGPDVDRRELFYNASVLAHYAEVSTGSASDWPTPSHLGEVFDHFVANPMLLHDGEALEHAGAQCLLLTGFFADQLAGRYNVGWYATLGASFFLRSAREADSPAKAELLEQLSAHFEPWRRRHIKLSRELRALAYLLAAPTGRVM